MSITDRIIDLAKEKDIKIAALEKAVGLGNGTIGKWRKQSPSCDKLLKVANYLNTSIDYLVTGRQDFENNHNISNSNVGAVGANSHGTVNVGTENHDDNKSERSSPEDFPSNNGLDSEVLTILHRLSPKEQHKMLIAMYEFEEECQQQKDKKV